MFGRGFSRKVLWFGLGGIALLVLFGPKPTEEELRARQVARTNAEIAKASEADRENARLDADIRHALKTTGVYVPPNARTIDYKGEALILCSRYAKSAARHPSTVNFSGWGARVSVHADNSADVTANFTAKNSFGLELKHHIACRVSPAGEVTATISEAE